MSSCVLCLGEGCLGDMGWDKAALCVIFMGHLSLVSQTCLFVNVSWARGCALGKCLCPVSRSYCRAETKFGSKPELYSPGNSTVQCCFLYFLLSMALVVFTSTINTPYVLSSSVAEEQSCERWFLPLTSTMFVDFYPRITSEDLFAVRLYQMCSQRISSVVLHLRRNPPSTALSLYQSSVSKICWGALLLWTEMNVLMCLRHLSGEYNDP